MIAETWCKTCKQAISTIAMYTGDVHSGMCITIDLKQAHLKCKRCIDSGVTLKIIDACLERINTK